MLRARRLLRHTPNPRSLSNDDIYLQMRKREKDGTNDKCGKRYKSNRGGKTPRWSMIRQNTSRYSEKLYLPTEIHIPSPVPGKRNRCVAKSVEGSGLTELPSAEEGLAEVVISSGRNDDTGSKAVKLG